MPKIIPDLDAKLDFPDDEELPTKEVKLFGRNWLLRADVNVFNAVALLGNGEASDVYKYMQSMVSEDDWEEFKTALSKVRNLSIERLWDILNAMAEAIADVPTVRPSASRPGPTKRTSSPKSKVGSSSPRAATSRR